MRKHQKQTLLGLPYVNTWQGISLTILINLVVTVVLILCNSINRNTFYSDAVICGFTTSIIVVAFVYPQIKKMRKAGKLPTQIMEGKILQKLPRRPVPFAITIGVIFAILMGIFVIVIAWFFEIDTHMPYRFLVWKLTYATFLSVKITEIAVLRFIQPDCIMPEEPEQTGDYLVKNPIPRKENFSHLFSAMTSDFGFNIVLGLIFGNTIIQGHNVILVATTRSGIIVGGLILGIILTFLIVFPVTNSMRLAGETGQLPDSGKGSLLSHTPYDPKRFTLFLLVPVMVITAAVLWIVFTFFRFEELHFFQFYIIRTVYASILSKVVIMIAVIRYSNHTDKQTKDIG